MSAIFIMAMLLQFRNEYLILINAMHSNGSMNERRELYANIIFWASDFGYGMMRKQFIADKFTEDKLTISGWE